MEKDVFSDQRQKMNDQFENHLSRLKSEKGPQWSKGFDDEYAYFKLCSLITAARDISGASVETVSEKTNVPKKVIALVEKQEPGASPDHVRILMEYFVDLLIKRVPSNLAGTASRLGALVSSMQDPELQEA